MIRSGVNSWGTSPPVKTRGVRIVQKAQTVSGQNRNFTSCFLPLDDGRYHLRRMAAEMSTAYERLVSIAQVACSHHVEQAALENHTPHACKLQTTNLRAPDSYRKTARSGRLKSVPRDLLRTVHLRAAGPFEAFVASFRHVDIPLESLKQLALKSIGKDWHATAAVKMGRAK